MHLAALGDQADFLGAHRPHKLKFAPLFTSHTWRKKKYHLRTSWEDTCKLACPVSLLSVERHNLKIHNAVCVQSTSTWPCLWVCLVFNQPRLDTDFIWSWASVNSVPVAVCVRVCVRARLPAPFRLKNNHWHNERNNNKRPRRCLSSVNSKSN